MGHDRGPDPGAAHRPFPVGAGGEVDLRRQLVQVDGGQGRGQVAGEPAIEMPASPGVSVSRP